MFNYTTMLSFVPNAMFITIIREPVNQFTSAWYVRGSIPFDQDTDSYLHCHAGTISRTRRS